MNRVRIVHLRHRKHAESSAPFSCAISDLRLRVEIVYYAQISLKSHGIFWQKVHRGDLWIASSVQPEHRLLVLSFPLRATLRIEIDGCTWIIDVPSQAPNARWPGSVLALRPSRYLTTSAAVHVLTMLFVVAMLSRSPDEIKSTAAGTSRLVTIELSSQGAVQSRYKTFSGVLFEDFFKQQQLSRRASHLRSVLMGLNELEFNASDIKQAASGVDKRARPDLRSQLIAQQVKAQEQHSSLHALDASNSDNRRRFAGDLGQTNSRPETALSTQSKRAVSEKFRQLQEDFRKLYSRTLSVDPNLSVTVVLTAEVTPKGYLELRSFDVEGTYSSIGIAQLHSGISSLLQSTDVGSELVGTLIRAENIFVR